MALDFRSRLASGDRLRDFTVGDRNHVVLGAGQGIGDSRDPIKRFRLDLGLGRQVQLRFLDTRCLFEERPKDGRIGCNGMQDGSDACRGPARPRRGL